MPKKFRADELLVERALCESIEEARKYIMAGQVRGGNDRVIQKASEMLPLEQALFLDLPLPYVSRGALKLKPALEKYIPDPSGLVALDLGSSTGGFTDLMLQNDVTKVFAVDVGTGQLHYKLRTDERVVSMEQTNARTLTSEHVPEPVDIVTSDVSFISVTKILTAASSLMKDGAYAFILVKPQFEVPRSQVGDGVIRDEALRLEMVEKVKAFAEENLSWKTIDVLPSDLKGPKGNQEYVVVFRK
ncbi:MAG: TlyA family RNA methyltransferase [Lentisphaeraceae bacterium]|nr:TlyA family RNA methyltransferase [Lentisphaeraceae bacterium]